MMNINEIKKEKKKLEEELIELLNKFEEKTKVEIYRNIGLTRSYTISGFNRIVFIDLEIRL